jgi:hypothetical protein
MRVMMVELVGRGRPLWSVVVVVVRSGGDIKKGIMGPFGVVVVWDERERELEERRALLRCLLKATDGSGASCK